MFKVGVVVASNRSWPYFVPDTGNYFVQKIETKTTVAKLVVGGNVSAECLLDEKPKLFDVIHLCFQGLSNQQVLKQLHVACNHPSLFTNLVIVLCEVDVSSGFDYEYIATYLHRKCPQRLHIDYFLVLSTVQKYNNGITAIALRSGHEIMNKTIESYYDSVLSVARSTCLLDSKVV